MDFNEISDKQVLEHIEHRFKDTYKTLRHKESLMLEYLMLEYGFNQVLCAINHVDWINNYNSIPPDEAVKQMFNELEKDPNMML